ncbi:hypothetical protein AQ436_06605 [Arthrobacter sp. EpRS66]|nr:hypothetical protein AQ436_06605 [Arthrobacter sp. EpRS66]
MAVTLDGLAVELPKEWASATLRKGFQESVVGKLSSSEPLPTNGKVIPIYEGGFEVGYTAEASRKPASDVAMTFKGIEPNKFAGLLAVSKEAARANPAQMLETVQQDMINAVARQLDFGIFYGKSAISGALIPGALPHVNQTTSRVELDETKDLVPQFLAGYDLASAGESDPDGFAFDSRYRTRVLLASQQQLAPAGGSSPMPNLAAATATFGGLTAAFGRTVAGRVGASAATDVKGFVGDWSKLRWGFSENLQLDRSEQASWVAADGTTHHAFQENMILYRVEFEAGWYLDPADFAAYETAPVVTP